MKMRKTPRYFSSQPEEKKWKLRLRQAGRAVVWPFKQKTTYVLVLLFAFFAPTFNGVKPAEAVSGFITSMGNAGPGLESISALGSYAAQPAAAKFIYTLGMFFGRVEIYPLIAVTYMMFRRNL